MIALLNSNNGYLTEMYKQFDDKDQTKFLNCEAIIFENKMVVIKILML
jgi:hypothetical protein